MAEQEGGDEGTTVLCADLLEMFDPHSRNGQPKDDSFCGWEVCQDLHDDELELQCVTNKPYWSSRCVTSSNSPVISPYRIFGGGSSTAPPSGRTSYVAPYGKRHHRAASDPSLRYITKFPMLFHGIKDIAYEFHHYPHHSQHIEAYRNSYTYILIRNFRDLRATGLAGTKLHAALRFNMCATTDCKQHAEGSCRSLHRERCHHSQSQTTPSPRRPNVTPPPVIYYSETCPTGPIVYHRGGSGKSSRSSDMQLTTVNPASICSGCSALPKSTMEMNAMTVKSSQQRPFGEQEGGFKGHKSLVKSPRPWKPPSSPELVRKRKNNASPSPTMSMVVGSSTVRKQTAAIRRMSPLGRVPVAVRRSSPSIRGRRDPSGSTIEGAKYLSIAMATHTVTSPYYRNNDDTDDAVRML